MKILLFFLGLGFLIMSVAVAYYLIIFIPQKENVYIELKKEEQLRKEKHEKETAVLKQKNKNALDQCITDAQLTTSHFWNNECKGLNLLSQSCIEFLDKGIEVYYDKSMTAEEIMQKNRECTCLLPEFNAQRVDQRELDLKNECFKKYPQN